MLALQYSICGVGLAIKALKIVLFTVVMHMEQQHGSLFVTLGSVGATE